MEWVKESIDIMEVVEGGGGVAVSGPMTMQNNNAMQQKQ